MLSTRRVRVPTRGNNDVVNITDTVAGEVRASGIREGVATIFVLHSTAGLTTVEYEPGLVADLKEAFDRLVPAGIPYRHNLAPGEDNGHSHVRASVLGPSIAVPIAGGQLLLGTWQQLVLVDFDVRPRTRDVVIQIAGE